MRRVWQHWRALLAAIVLGIFSLGPTSSSAANYLHWRTNDNRVDAEITAWRLPTLLSQVAAATGWRIYIEPETEHVVSTKFKDRAPGEALRLLLGDLSFALLPQPEGPGKLLVFRTTMQEATQLVPPAPREAAKPKHIPNELIVILKPGQNIDDLARKLGAKVTGRVDELNAYRLEFEDAAAADAAREKLKNNEDVASVDYNYPVLRPQPGQDLPLGYSPALSLKPRAVGDAERMIVGLVDTAVQPQGRGMDEFLLPSITVGNGKGPENTISHGTAMAETILRGLAFTAESKDGTAVRILPVDVYGSNPTSSTFDVALGIYKAINAGAMIINLSLGSDGDTTVLRNVIQSGAQQGVLFLAAAGNEPVTTASYPAAYPEVIAVTAGDRAGNIASYANRGDFVDVIAPGSAIVSYNNQNYVVMGTSPATAYVSGMAGALADEGKKTPAAVGPALRKALGVSSAVHR